jgi:hypothetical protein
MAAPKKSADGSVTVETRWMEGKGQFVNEFVLDISLLMEGFFRLFFNGFLSVTRFAHDGFSCLDDVL